MTKNPNMTEALASISEAVAEDRAALAAALGPESPAGGSLGRLAEAARALNEAEALGDQAEPSPAPAEDLTPPDISPRLCALCRKPEAVQGRIAAALERCATAQEEILAFLRGKFNYE